GAQRVVHGLDQAVVPTLLGRARVVRSQRLGQRVDDGLDRGAAFQGQPSVETVHAARLADEELAPLIVVLDLGLEAGRVDGMPGPDGDVAQVFDREASGVADPHLFVDALADLTDPRLQMADRGRRLKADLTRA